MYIHLYGHKLLGRCMCVQVCNMSADFSSPPLSPYSQSTKPDITPIKALINLQVKNTVEVASLGSRYVTIAEASEALTQSVEAFWDNFGCRKLWSEALF